MQAAQTTGCVPHLVLTGRSSDVQGQTLPPSFPAHTRVHTDLAAFVDHLLGDASSMSLT
jgi:D-glycero-D-manno-heptose 1,7-bisphosphate phosphatase